MESNELCQRLLKFSVDVVRLLRTFKSGIEQNVISYQLTKSSGSSGANYEESQAAVSKADFVNKVGISLKEMRESNYWLRILKELYPKNQDVLNLVIESGELKKILAAICFKASSNQ